VIVAPVLNFDMATVTGATKVGVGGLLFLGNAAAPSSLASELGGATAEPSPLVMADEEGGGIQRLAGAVTSVPWPREMATTMAPGQIQTLAGEVGRQMRQLGVNVDLAPVLDIDGGEGPSSTDPDGLRSFSPQPAVAGQDGIAFMRGLQSGGVIAVVKHFPGLGGASGNTDSGPAATPPIATLQTGGLVPFRAAITAGATAVMVANATVPGLTDLPASLSSSVIGGLLRTQLGFGGLVLTDSLSAGAVSQAGYPLPRAAVAAITAGADMVLFGSTLTAAETRLLTPQNVAATTDEIIAALVHATAAGTLSADRLDVAVEHVVAARRLNLCASRA
jgi:beta-N-acetylhexosaminidase